MSSSFSSSRFPTMVRKAFELLLTSRRALIWLSMATRAVDSEASGRKRNLASGESQYVSRRRGRGDASDGALSQLRPIMATSVVIRSEASPSSDDAKMASSGDEVASSLDDGAMEELPTFNNLPCWLQRRRVLFAGAMLLIAVIGLLL